MKNGIFLLLVLFNFLSNDLVGQEFKIEKDRKKFTVPISTVDGIVVVPVSINGSIPLNFILDTGSPYTVITNFNAIKYFQLRKGKAVTISGLGKDTQTLEAYLSNE
ncbi:aspartyl protease family protein, partial [Mycobacterium sp.]|uniref:aspartyl protease family protein n=1 Tax=Mycobacterium sp. TaxID=1785 RepID=UPI003A8B7058